jgi:NAD(P)-dependent dehydrogenase (short-subunit alcohol dehydrogenase family)
MADRMADGTILITGSASGMGAATAERLRGSGRSVIGADLSGADIEGDIATPEGRRAIVEAAAALDRPLDGVATFAGVSGFGGRRGSEVVSIDYFGTVDVLEGLRPLLAAATKGAAAVAVSSNTATSAPGIDADLVEACLAGDERAARARADELGGAAAYAAAKLAVARWVRRRAPAAEWAGAGVSLNAIAPGYTLTALTEEMLEDPGARRILERMPLPIGRPGRPDEIAALAALLLGEEARFIVGSVLFIDGGTDAVLRGDDWPVTRPRAAPRPSDS